MTWVELEESQRGVGGVQWRGGIGEAEKEEGGDRCQRLAETGQPLFQVNCF